MAVGRMVNWMIKPLGVRLVNTADFPPPGSAVDPKIYDEDGLRTVHNSGFVSDPEFVRAYQRAVKAAGQDYHYRWRVHVALWAAWCASRLEGDFVECGVSWGSVSSAIMESLHWDNTGKTFFLLDTFAGLDDRVLTDAERADGILDMQTRLKSMGYYALNVDSVRANFAQWKNVRIIQGTVPDTLKEIAAEKIAYLHLDMNCSAPEVAAAEYLWDRLVPGALILMDDYTYRGADLQYSAMNDFARRRGTKILSLPTGQGLIIR